MRKTLLEFDCRTADGARAAQRRQGPSPRLASMKRVARRKLGRVWPFARSMRIL